MINVSDLQAHVQGLVDRLNGIEPTDLAELERVARKVVLELGAEAVRLACTEQKGYVGSGVSCECGGRMRYVADRTRWVETTCGPIRLKRAYYHCQECGASWFPLDEAMSVRQGWSPGMRQLVALCGMQLPYAQAADLMGRLSGVKVSSTALQNLTEAAGEKAEESIETAGLPEEETPAARETPSEQRWPVIQIDGTMTPLRGRWAETKIGLVRHGDGRVRYVHHMGGPDPLGQRLRRTAARMGVRRTSSVVVMGDGAPWIWKLSETCFPGATEIVDWYHVVEHVNTAAREVFGEGDRRGHAWARRLRDRLWNQGAQGALKFLAGSRYASHEAVQALRQYLTRNRERMRYPHFRARGLDIGSGQVESACKQLVQARMKRAGMRWTERDASRVIALRCIYLSGLWDTFWRQSA